LPPVGVEAVAGAVELYLVRVCVDFPVRRARVGKAGAGRDRVVVDPAVRLRGPLHGLSPGDGHADRPQPRDLNAVRQRGAQGRRAEAVRPPRPRPSPSPKYPTRLLVDVLGRAEAPPATRAPVGAGLDPHRARRYQPPATSPRWWARSPPVRKSWISPASGISANLWIAASAASRDSHRSKSR
jgi:hypothetical protein